MVATPADHRDEIERILARLDSLTDDDVLFVADLWLNGDAAARRRAWAKAKAVIAGSGNQRVLDEVRRVVGEWMRPDRADFHGIQGLLGMAGSMAAIRQAAAPAVLDAAAGTLAGNALGPEDRAALLGPWQTLVAEMDQSSACRNS